MSQKKYVNYYRVLEVDPRASKEVIEKRVRAAVDRLVRRLQEAYKALSLKYHPDININGKKEQANKEMISVNEAYSVLSDNVKREEYDKRLLKMKISILLSEGLIGLLRFRRSKEIIIDEGWY